MKWFIAVSLILMIFIVGCSTDKGKTISEGINYGDINNGKNDEIINEVVLMKLSSPDFKHNSMMPSELTCDGDDKSPELNIADVPKNAKSLVLINDDPDAPVGVWDHWIVFNIPPATAKISKGVEPQGIGGKNSWGRTGYGGPCPPSGVHRYFFKLYALDTMLSLKEGAAKKEIESAMQGYIIAKTELIGLYKRQ